MALEKGKITSTGFIMLVFAFVIGTSILQPPGRAAEQDAWIAILIGLAEALVIATVFLSLAKRFPGKTLVEISDLVYGPYLGKMVSIIFLWYLFHLGSLVLTNYTDYFSALFLMKTPPIVLLASTALVCISAAKRGIDVITRCSVILVLIAIFYYFLTTGLLIMDFEIKNLQPVQAAPAVKLLWAAHGAASIPFAETVVFLMIIPFLNKKQEAHSAVFKGIIIAGLVMLGSAVMNTGVLGAAEKAYIYPSYQAISIINIAEIITRLEILVSLTLLGMGFLKTAVLLYSVSLGTAQMLSLRSHQPLVLPVAVLMIILALYNFPNAGEYIRFINNAYPIYALPYQVIIPLLTLIIAAIRKTNPRAQKTSKGGK